ncbi:hypothetical protein JNW90_19560 [Micromonospora sp. STR1s_5]|nr:hypothetical protein [Micromonospora sp. STR1s_5]
MVSATSEPYFDGGSAPRELDRTEIRDIVSAFRDATGRADRAGFDILEIHCGHGYLLASFLSPTINTRSDEYGRDLAGRMRFPLDVVAAVRARWPTHKPLLVRISAVHGAENGWSLEDSLAFGHELKRLGVDVIDCSSGGARSARILQPGALQPGYKVPYAAAVRRRCSIASMAVGLIFDGVQAESILRAGEADLIAVGREALGSSCRPAAPDGRALLELERTIWLVA